MVAFYTMINTIVCCICLHWGKNLTQMDNLGNRTATDTLLGNRKILLFAAIWEDKFKMK